MAEIMMKGRCVTWECEGTPKRRNRCDRCYDQLLNEEDFKPVRTTSLSRKKGKCKKCGQYKLLRNKTKLCTNCHKAEWQKSERAKKVRDAYYKAHKDEYAKRSAIRYAKHGAEINARRLPRKREKDDQVPRGDASSLNARRPSWFYMDTKQERIAWSFALDHDYAFQDGRPDRDAYRR